MNPFHVLLKLAEPIRAGSWLLEIVLTLARDLGSEALRRVFDALDLPAAMIDWLSAAAEKTSWTWDDQLFAVIAANKDGDDGADSADQTHEKLARFNRSSSFHMLLQLAGGLAKEIGATDRFDELVNTMSVPNVVLQWFRNRVGEIEDDDENPWGEAATAAAEEPAVAGNAEDGVRS